jgi:hydroxymethylpyrimidine pyrophosphatase-like HAD family hydrolase
MNPPALRAAGYAARSTETTAALGHALRKNEGGVTLNSGKRYTLNVTLTLLGVIGILVSMIIGTVAEPQQALWSIGLMLMGYGLIETAISIYDRLSDLRRAKKILERYAFSVEVIEPRPKDLPRLLLSDIEGCITPLYRAQVDLVKFSRLRAYCEFVQENRDFPQLVFYTGRSQGYVELLAQSLGILDSARDLPFVIENGAALYMPRAKKTHSLIERSQILTILETRKVLEGRFPSNEFEPKSFMVSLNPVIGETVDQLRDKVNLALKDQGLLDDLSITSTASAVDISPSGVSKLSGLQKALPYLELDGQPTTLDQIVAFGDQIADLDVLKAVGRPYCPMDSHAEVKKYVGEAFGPAHIVDKPHIDVVISVIERECGLHIA